MDKFTVRNGYSIAPVCLCSDASETCFTAAKELCRYLSLQSGMSVEPASGQACKGGICIGYNRCDMGDDGFT
ncbi:MAG: hypothetical protein IIX84_04425, partial [Oscillospiraceae bacterium]|nr:hypothetical protein [Oscillospiraceae bacterium]